MKKFKNKVYTILFQRVSHAVTWVGYLCLQTDQKIIFTYNKRTL